METIRCSNCKVNLPQEHFEKKRCGNFYKLCNQCREYKKSKARNNKCPHGKRKTYCLECPDGGGSLCEHKIIKYGCKICKGSNICEHNKKKQTCKICVGSSICEHNIIKYGCKVCKGSAICEHNRDKRNCKDCKGNNICEHDKQKNMCQICGGNSLCEHGRSKYKCVQCGTGRCEHGRSKNKCRDCGTGYCEHDVLASRCKQCGGGSICEHGTRRSQCKFCNLGGYIAGAVRDAVRHGLKADKSKKSIEYLGCPIDEFKQHIEKQFQEGMTWDNHGKWHIDHLVPLKYNNPTIEEVIERLHYTNTQPLWASENISKGNRFIG